MLDAEDYQLITLTSSASLDRSPGKNWVENSGQLPPYIRKLARAIEKDGHSLSEAIAIAISQVKRWAKGGEDVDADTRAKAAKAVAQWEKLKAKNKAKQIVKMSREDGSEFLELSNVSSFNTEVVRRAWDAQQRAKRQAYEKAYPSQNGMASPAYDMYPYSWIRELWTNFIIVEVEDRDGLCFQKVPYTVAGDEVTFSEPESVEQVWKDSKGELSETEKTLLKNILVQK